MENTHTIEHSSEISKLLATYLTTLRIQRGKTVEDIYINCNMAESTVKGLLRGTSDSPGIKTVQPVMDYLGGSWDEMFGLKNIKKEIKSAPADDLKSIYEFQIALIKENSEIEKENIRKHYEAQIAEIKESNRKNEEHYERRLHDKREHIETILLDKKWFRLASVIGIAGLIILFLFIEFASPGHGWLNIDSDTNPIIYLVGLVSVVEFIAIIVIVSKRKNNQNLNIKKEGN